MVVTFKWENDDDDKGVEGNDGNYDDDDEEEGEQGVAETIKRENENQRKKLKSKEETKE